MITLPFYYYYYYYSPNASFALPSFPRYTVYDDGRTGNVDDFKYQYNNFTAFRDLPLDLWAATYLSDGTNFNVTLWLVDRISSERHQYYFNAGLRFQVDLYNIDPVNGTADYFLYSIIVSPEQDGTWTKTVVEYGPPAADGLQYYDKVLKVFRNYSGFFENNNTYVDIPIFLADMGNPPAFGVGFGTYAQNYSLSDFMFVENAPKSRNEISYEPLSMKARAGEITTFDISVHALDLNVRHTLNLHDANPDDDIQLDFQPNTLDIGLNGTVKTNLILNLPRDVQVGQIMPVVVYVNGTTAKSLPLNPYNVTFSIEVLAPVSTEERITDFLNKSYGIYWIPFGITGAFALWLARRVDQGAVSSTGIGVKDILAVNASVIAGVLIFLTLGGTTLYSGSSLSNIGILTASIVWPFAISAIVTLTTGRIQSGVKWTIPGFVYLMVSVVLIAFVF